MQVYLITAAFFGGGEASHRGERATEMVILLLSICLNFSLILSSLNLSFFSPEREIEDFQVIKVL